MLRLIRVPYFSHSRREKSLIIFMARPVSSMIKHVPQSGRSIAHSRENDRFYVEKVHICRDPQWNEWKTADSHIISSDSNPTGTAPSRHIQSAAGKQQPSSKQQGSSRQPAGKQQASSRQAAASNQASSRQAARKQASKQASKQQTSSSRQAEQASSSNQCMALETRIELFPGARPPDTIFTS